MSRFKSFIFVLVIGLAFTSIQVGAGDPAVYRVFVDESYGFKRVIEVNYTPIEYTNLTLNINVSDTVIWVNDADNESLTIVSEQNLWDNRSSYLRETYRSFNYTFTQPGTYNVYMKEFPRVRHQTIVVRSLETPTPIATPTETPTAIPTLSPTVKETAAQAATPMFNLWYILIAAIIVVGIILYLYSSKRR